MVFLYFITKSDPIFVFYAQLLALVPGKLGSYLRVAYYKQTIKTCSDDIFIGFGSYLTNPYVEIGSKVYIGAYNIIGIATLANHVTIASHVSVLSGKQQHGYKEIGKPIQEQKGQFSRVTINENCWIGNGAIIMADLGVQNVVAAGSVITKNTDDYEIWAGNPAILIKKIN
jgi:acetyltransferase-like isoleucine patch superfamily enzyme